MMPVQTKYGGIAQLGERLNGIQEVSGSISLISTMVSEGTLRKVLKTKGFRTFSFLKLWFSLIFVIPF